MNERLRGGFDRALYPAAPAERLAMLRVLIGGFALVYVISRAPYLMGFAARPAEQFAPVGVTAWLDAPLGAWWVYGQVIATIMAGIGFVAGWRFAVTGPLFAGLLLWVTTYRNAWGMVFHTENLMVLHVLALALAPAAVALSMDSRGRAPPPGEEGRFGWPIRLMSILTVISYALAGHAKLEAAGWSWVSEDILRNHVAYDNLRKLLLGDLYSPLGGWLVQFDWLWPPLALLSMGLELCAPLLLFSGRAARLWSVLMWGFHVGVLALMAIVFPYQLAFVAFLSFFHVERLLTWWRRTRARRG